MRFYILVVVIFTIFLYSSKEVSADSYVSFGGTVMITSIQGVICIGVGKGPIILSSNAAAVADGGRSLVSGIQSVVDASSAGDDEAKAAAAVKTSVGVGSSLYKMIPYYANNPAKVPKVGGQILGKHSIVPNLNTCSIMVGPVKVPFPVFIVEDYGVSESISDKADFGGPSRATRKDDPGPASRSDTNEPDPGSKASSGGRVEEPSEPILNGGGGTTDTSGGRIEEPSSNNDKYTPDPFDLGTLNLKKGSKGNYVKNLQTNLNEFWGENLKVDGDFGVKTESAVKKFQINHKLKDDGIVGRLTKAELFNINNDKTGYNGIDSW